MNVQRSALDEGGESLNVEPQAYGGRKILVLINIRNDIWSTFKNTKDFDGDVLNVFYIINELFAKRAEVVFSPKYAMMISHDDGKFDSAMNHSRDTLIMLNSFVNLSRDAYTAEELDLINKCKSME